LRSKQSREPEKRDTEAADERHPKHEALRISIEWISTK
jgi:hypothetical protein